MTAEQDAQPRQLVFARRVQRLAGAVLLALVLLPLYRLLDHADTGLAGEFTVQLTAANHASLWLGLLVLLLIGGLGARYLPAAADDALRRAASFLSRIPLPAFAAGLALLAALLGSGFAAFVLKGEPGHIDAIAQLAHARYLADGSLAGPVWDGGGFRALQNALFTERGWVSHYPPGHVAVLALFLALGLPWLAGPLLTGLTVFFATLTIERLLPARLAVARAAAIAATVSPFVIGLGASWMNHVTAAAGLSVAAYALVRAWQDSIGWAALAGAGLGCAFVTRPLSTVPVALALAVTVPLTRTFERALPRVLRTLAVAAAAAAPFLIALFAWNAHFFGSPLRFGYAATLGPAVSPGFHRDPWGNAYGVTEALAYTSADLIALSVNLLETPLPAVAVVGAFLLLSRSLDTGERVLTAWALAPVASNFFYWHHGLYMGPRMLHEVSVPWAMLFVVAAAGLVRMAPAVAWQGLRLRPGLLTVVLAGFAGALVLAPKQIAAYSVNAPAPAPAVRAPALVFVHDNWSSRIAATLSSHGYRLDVVETLLRQNTTCALQALADAVYARDQSLERTLRARLDTVPRAADLPAVVTTGSGSVVRTAAGERFSPECARQMHADAAGSVSVASLLWRGDLPESAPEGALFVRDMGPARNRGMIAAHPQREPFMYMMPAATATLPVLVPYAEGEARLWGRP